MGDDRALRFRLEELRRAVDIQRDTVDALHGRANLLLVALLGVVAFLGPTAIDRAELAGPLVAGVGLLLALAAFLEALRPRRFSWFADTQAMGTLRVDDPTVTVSVLISGLLPSFVESAAANARNIALLSRAVRCEAAATVATAVGLFVVVIVA